MSEGGTSRLGRIDGDVLAPVVREALRDADAAVAEWDCEVVKGDWTPCKGIVCRFFGRARTSDGETSWSLFLKVPSPAVTHRDPIRREAFQRELRLYRSGVFERFPDSIAAARLLAVTEHPDDEPWLWLEDVSGSASLDWPVARFGAAAHHFGLMQGAFLAGAPLPDEPWVDISRRLRPAMAAGFERAGPILRAFERHPLTSPLWTSDIGRGVRQLWAERETFVDALDRMPRTFCHGDFCYPNLFSRRLPGGREQTVVIDWQYAGVRQIGGDVAGLIADSSILPVRRKAAEPEEFAELVLDGYLAGLGEAGWQGDLRIARFACLARLALPWGLNLLSSLNGRVLTRALNSNTRHDLEGDLAEYIRRQRFLLALADEARRLLEAIGP